MVELPKGKFENVVEMLLSNKLGLSSTLKCFYLCRTYFGPSHEGRKNLGTFFCYHLLGK